MSLQPLISIRNANPADFVAARRLLAAYPYKIHQQRTQALDPDRLSAFHASCLEKALASPNPDFIVQRLNEPIALAGLVPDPWRGEIYGMKMGRVQPWLNTISPPAVASILLPMPNDRTPGIQMRRLDAVHEAGVLPAFEKVEGEFVDRDGTSFLRFSVPKGTQEIVVE